MSLEGNKQVVRRVFEEFTNQRNLESADELFSPDIVDHGARTERAGIAGIRDSLRLFLNGFPDFQYKIEDIFAEGDRVHVRGTISGTHRGTFAGIPATGNSVTMSAMEDFRIENGKIVERWAERDRVSLMSQLKGGKTMSLEENKRIVRRVFEEFTNQQKAELAEELFHPDFEDHGAPPARSGIAGVRESLRLMVIAYPDLHYTIEDMRAEGDEVHVRGTISGTNLGTYAGAPPSGKSVSFSAMDDFRFADGKIVERWSQRDNITKLVQVGAFKPRTD